MLEMLWQKHFMDIYFNGLSELSIQKLILLLVNVQLVFLIFLDLRISRYEMIILLIILFNIKHKI